MAHSPIIEQYAVATTTDNDTAVQCFTKHVNNGDVVVAVAHVTGRNGSQTNAYYVICKFEAGGGAAAAAGNTTLWEHEDDADWDVYWDANDADMRLNLAGDAADSVSWVSYITLYYSKF